MNKKEILKSINTILSRPLKLRDLARELEISASQYSGFRRQIKELLAEGELVRLKRGRIGLPARLDLQVGKISVSKTGIGFLIWDKSEPDILIPPSRLSTAFDGDTVLVRREGFERGRQVGSVISIQTRSRKQVVGVYHRGKSFSFVKPDDIRIHRDIYVSGSGKLNPRTGQRVVVKLSDWTDPYLNPEGEVIEILGKPGNRRVDLLAIVRTYEFPEEFSAESLRLAEKASKKWTDEVSSNREDLRHKLIYTIDPADAKDHDDAFHIERIASGYRLGVHIADVSFFVDEDSALDKEALGRGNSVYLPGKVIPMLPEIISNDLCSLRPNQDRLAHSVFIDFDKSGKMTDWRVAETIIRSRHKLSYEDAQEIIERKKPVGKSESVEDSLALAYELSRKLTKRRAARGSLDFDLPEPLIELDQKWDVVKLGTRVRLDSHKLVEEFMLAANQAVALMAVRLGVKMLFRVHDRPDLEKLEQFAQLAKAFGYNFAVSDTTSPKMAQEFLVQLKGEPEEEYLSELLLRSMKKAVYQPENIGHFGLAFKNYAHFTSPIRRYPDLVVHRILKSLKNGHIPVAYDRKLSKSLSNIGSHCSERERIAERAEREAIKMFQASYLAKHVGDEFNGIISGVIGRGFFVRLDGIRSEGMVRVSSIDDDFYHHDESRHRLIGARKKRVFRMGDRVKVQVIKVDIERREIDLELVESQGSKRSSKRVGGKAKRPAPRRKRGKR
ncbi:MAG: ribonuclease R [candidate division Zixibacteria bacterium]|nr:ribonuclease R [candidate division Zixibacteria bacterium]